MMVHGYAHNANVGPLLTAALAALELEAKSNPDAAGLACILEQLPHIGWIWRALEVINHFQCEGPIKSRPALMSVLLKELSETFPVPASLLQ